jgi:hypothetical protein
MEKPMKNTEKRLDKRIADALANPDQPAEHIAALLSEIGVAITEAERTAHENRGKAFDPAVLDPTARGKMDDATFIAQRLRNAQTALAPHYKNALRKEEEARWEADAVPLELKVTKLSRELLTVYPDVTAKLADLFARISASEAEIRDQNAKARGAMSYDENGHARYEPGMRLLAGVEETALGREVGFIGKVKLPALPFNGSMSAPDVWPPKPRDFGLEYAESVRRAMQGAPLPPTEEQRIEASRRHLADGMEREKESRRLSAEAAARAHAYEIAQRRIAAGG